MVRFVPLAAAALVAAAAGCKSQQPFGGTSTLGEPQPTLLVGPEAAAKAPPPVELPAKETTQLCLVTAQNYEKEGRVEDAILLFEKVRSTDPANALAARRLVALYDKTGDFAKSATLYETLVKAHPKDADLLNDLGYSHYSRGAWAEAVAVLTQAVQIDPKHVRAWVNLGMAQAQLGQWDASYEAFCKGVRPADAHANVAFALAVQGKTAEAKVRYQQALALDPGSRVAQAGLAQLEKPPAPPRSLDVVRGKGPKLSPAEAAAQVPSVLEIEERLKKEAAAKQVTRPGVSSVTAEPESDR